MKTTKIIFLSLILSFLISCSSFDKKEHECTIKKDYTVILPQEKREIPEPLLKAEKPGFKLRGIKGWGWDAEQYLTEIPVLAEYKMNFLMNCYLSMYDLKNKDIRYEMFSHTYTAPDKWCNNWWMPLKEDKKKAYEEVVKKCQEYKIDFCFAMNPNLLSNRPLQYDSEKDFNDLWQHYEWMQSLGVKWFSICFDDIKQGIDASGQAKFINKLLNSLRKNDSTANLILTPTHYRGAGDDDEYLITLAKEMHKDVYVFWAGEMSFDIPYLKKETVEKYKKNVGHRIIIWDNYPVNDANYTLHLGPVRDRDVDLCDVADGFMSNSMCWQNEINRLPLITIADYTYNPAKYEPDRAIGQAILHVADTKEQQEILKELVELYPGRTLYERNMLFNPLLFNFRIALYQPDGKEQAKNFIHYVEDFAARFNKVFPGKYKAEKETIDNNINTMKTTFKEKFGEDLPARHGL